MDLNAQLGLLWQAKEDPDIARKIPSEFPQNLFDVQDSLDDPRSFYVWEEDELMDYDDDIKENFDTNIPPIVPIACENQSNWQLGFAPDNPENLWAFEYWYEEGENVPANGLTEYPVWVKMRSSLEDGLIYVLLSNFLWTCAKQENVFDENNPEKVPAETDQLLWRLPATPSVSFWTNTERTAMYFSSAHMIVRR